MHRTAIAAAAALFAAAAAGPAAAACKAPAAADEMTPAQAAAVFDCLKAGMQAGYAKGPKRWIPKSYVSDYRSWTVASSAPAAPGVHGDRFLMTWVNAAGAETYLKYADEGVSVPAGTVIAKESFTIGKDGTARPGPRPG